MTQYVQLMGVEQVQSVGIQMRDAAHEMHRSTNLISESLRQFMYEFKEQIDRLEALHEKSGR